MRFTLDASNRRVQLNGPNPVRTQPRSPVTTISTLPAKHTNNAAMMSSPSSTNRFAFNPASAATNSGKYRPNSCPDFDMSVISPPSRNARQRNPSRFGSYCHCSPAVSLWRFPLPSARNQREWGVSCPQVYQ
jgi:hypothetical protein